MKKEKIGIILLIISGVAALTTMIFIDPITQDQAYHQFADDRTILGIPNFWNVISNAALLFVGLIGFKKLNVPEGTNYLYKIFFLGLILASFGSAYYHWAPENETLVWDRLPMTISFMSLFAIVICEFISVKIGKGLFIPLNPCWIAIGDRVEIWCAGRP